MTELSEVDGNILDGVSATTPWTLHSRGSEAKQSDSIPGVRAARDIAYPPGRGPFKLAAWPPLDRVGFMRRIRPGITLPEFES